MLAVAGVGGCLGLLVLLMTSWGLERESITECAEIQNVYGDNQKI
jgi:hypothetical protein